MQAIWTYTNFWKIVGDEAFLRVQENTSCLFRLPIPDGNVSDVGNIHEVTSTGMPWSVRGGASPGAATDTAERDEETMQDLSNSTMHKVANIAFI